MSEQEQLPIEECDEPNDIVGETKAERFSRLATARLRKLLKQFDVLGNCANTATYEYSDAQLDKMFAAIDKSYNACKEAFRPQHKDNENITL